MLMKSALGSTASGVVVYVVVACASDTLGHLPGPDQSSGEFPTVGAMMDPVPTAKASDDGSRIVNTYRTTGDGLRTQEGYWDTQLGMPCSFLLAADGKERCLPSYLGGSLFYADANCASPVVGLQKGCAVSSTVMSGAVDVGCAAAVRFTIYTVGAGFAGAVIYARSAAGCTATDASVYSVLYDLYSAAEVPAATYVEGTLVHSG